MKVSYQYRYFLGLLLVCTLGVHYNLNAQWQVSKPFNNNAPGTKIASVCSDASGNVYMAGSISSNGTFPTFSFDAITLSPAGAIEGFVAKFNSSGTCVWAIRFGGTSNDRADGIATNGTNVYVVGRFTNSMTVGASPTSYSSAGGTDGVVMSLNASSGATNWVTTFGGSSFDWGQAICLDPSNNVYISGTFSTAATFGAFNRTETGGGTVADMFVAKLNSTGTFQWANSGGSSNNDDNVNGSGICYVPGLNQIIFVGSYESATATYSPLSFTNAGSDDLILLAINAATGVFQSGISAGGPNADQALGVTWDPINQRALFTGSFSSASISIGGNTITNGQNGSEDILYAAYTPSTTTVNWAKRAGSSGTNSDADRGSAICTNGRGEAWVAGTYGSSGTATISFPTASTPLTLTNSRGAAGLSGLYMVKIDGATGNALTATQGTGNNTSALGDQATGVAALTLSPTAWLAGSFSGGMTFSPLAQINSFTSTPYTTVGLFLAKYNDPPAALSAGSSFTSPTCNNGCNGTATVTPTGGYPPYTYSWSPSGGSAATATGLCVGTYVCTITDAANTSIPKSVAVTAPTTTMPTAVGSYSNTAFSVNASNTIIADASCNLICKLVPSGGSQVNGNVSAKMWIESGVPVYGQPFVARHYEITPATNPTTSTGTLTLYFSQAEFTAFNSSPKSILDLPANSGDAVGKSHLYIGKYPGTSSNGTGLPATYSGNPTVFHPLDANITFNAGANRWEVTFDVSGFSGFVVQTVTVALPIVWNNVTASLNTGGYAQIKWDVEEQDVSSYTVEQSADGNSFVPVYTVSSQGNGTHFYQYTQSQPLQGTAYFRIKQTDKNGDASYSKTMMLKSDARRGVTVYPNPVKGRVTINITDNDALNTTATLCDLNGKVLKQVRIVQTVTTIDMQSFTKGIYLLKLKNGETIKIMKE